MHEDERARLGARRSAVPPRLPLAAAAWAGPWPLKTSCDGLDASGSNGLQAGLLETVLPEGSPVIAGSVPTLIIYRVCVRCGCRGFGLLLGGGVSCIGALQDLLGVSRQRWDRTWRSAGPARMFQLLRTIFIFEAQHAWAVKLHSRVRIRVKPT